MEIKTDKYILRSDAQCYWIEQMRISEKTGKETSVRVSGYYSKLEDLFVSFLERKTRDSDKTEMEAVLKEINTALEDAKAIIREYVKDKCK